jgi:hypothetical protein
MLQVRTDLVRKQLTAFFTPLSTPLISWPWSISSVRGFHNFASDNNAQDRLTSKFMLISTLAGDRYKKRVD